MLILRNRDHLEATSLANAPNTTSPTPMMSESKTLLLIVRDVLHGHVRRDSDDQKSEEPDGIDMAPQTLLAIICDSVFAVFIIIGLVWLVLHLHRRRKVGRARSASFHPLKDMDNRSQDSLRPRKDGLVRGGRR
ncbi:hypothetical protein GGR54DRAFT_569260 [Hypoxylon sp. NC1633]|nr:hypothetical protein GGR54DRAFT_569260 [Hypoxylon sp. NC1633]